MKKVSNGLLAIFVAGAFMVACNDGANTAENQQESTDSADQHFNPAAEQQKSSTFEPRKTITDTLYKNIDSFPKE